MGKERGDLRGDLHGLVIIDKPIDLTSFKAVKAVKTIFKVKKAGHTGTLDPFATGVLPICLNKATKLAGLVTGLDKEYRTVIRLGQSSDTYDRTGEVTDHEVGEYPALEEVEKAIAENFRGEFMQAPPIYSAIKVSGRPLYKRARKGETFDVESRARKVRIERFEILRYEAPELEVEIQASKGTYVRSLAHDLGKLLGTGGLLSELVRTRVGPYNLDQAHTLDQLRDLAGEGRLDEAVLGPEQLLAWLPEFAIARADYLELSQGHDRSLEDLEGTSALEGAGPLPRGGYVRLADRGGKGFVVAESTRADREAPDSPWVLRPFRTFKNGASLL